MDNWKSFPVSFAGGLVNNVPEVEQGVSLPGTARKLVNFEPSLSGGYRRIEGYTRAVMNLHDLLVMHPARVATFRASPAFSLNVYYTSKDSFQIGDYIRVGFNFYAEITGISDFYTYVTISFSTNTTSNIPAGTPVYKATSAGDYATSIDNDVATMTLYNASGEPGASFYTFVRSVSSYFGLRVYKKDSTDVNGFDCLLRNGTNPLVNGAGQTGVTLAVDGLEYKPNVGDTFLIAGLSGQFIVESSTDLVNGGCTLTLDPFTSLPSSPADNAKITWLGSGLYRLDTTGTLDGARFGGIAKYTKNSIDERLVVCFTVPDNSTNKCYPILLFSPEDIKDPPVGGGITGNCYHVLNDTTDLKGASTCVYHKNQLFFGNESRLIFSAPYDERDYSAASGGGVIDVGSTIVSLKSFRDTLYIFCTNKIFKLVGNTAADFLLQPVTENLGCAYQHSIQEIGGDIMFLAEDGLRLLSATERIGDINLAAVSRPVQKQVEVINALRPEGAAYTAFIRSIPIKDKSQYRIFRWQSNVTRANSVGIIAAQTEVNNNIAISFAETKGIKVKSCDFSSAFDVYAFTTGEDAKLYFMDKGNRFGADVNDANVGVDIPAVFATPFFTFDDARIRKPIHKVTLYVETDNTVSISTDLKLDFENTGVIQPSTVVFSTGTDKGNVVSLVGNGFSGSLEFSNTSSVAPFTLESAALEYTLTDRR